MLQSTIDTLLKVLAGIVSVVLVYTIFQVNKQNKQTMTPEEIKAKELVDKFMPLCYVPWMGGEEEAAQEECAKEAAIICVDEILEQAVLLDWNKVKAAIQKL